MKHQTIGKMIEHRFEESAGSVAIRHRVGNAWTDIAWGALQERCENIATGLMTALEGDATLEPRSAIAILGNTSADWIACDFACMVIGLRTVPVYATLLPEEVGYLHTDTESVITIVDDAEQLAKVRQMRNGFTFFDKAYGADLVKLRHIVVIDPTGVEPADDWESLSDLEKRGAERKAELAAKRKEWGDIPTRDDVCTYTYTSGTTGPPKGVIQTNNNMLAIQEITEEAKGLFSYDVAKDGLFLFLPLAHSFGRLIEHASPFHNVPTVIATIPTLVQDLGETRPGVFVAAPRVFEKMKARIEGAVSTASPTRQKLFHWAVGVGLETVPYRNTGQALPGFLGLKARVADKLVLSKLRGRLGLDRTNIVLSGSAPLSEEVHSFFCALQLDVLEGYGLTETCPALTVGRPGAVKVGTVGQPLPHIEIKIADDGEILAKGPNITQGYLNRPDATGEAFNDDGWFHTGDLGTMDSDGFVKITGRKKELMKTSGGKYIAPAKIENRIKNHTLIQEAVTVADTRNYATALIAIDEEELAIWADQRGVAADPKGEAVLAEVQKHVDGVNTTLAKYETIKYFRIIPALTTDNGFLTASLKVKRRVVYSEYADLIDDMYTQGAKKG